MAGSAGIFLFYVQHQFEDVYWETGENWDYADAAIRGSSFFKLPRILQYFTGNIGFHHVHHLSARIPNYNLQRAHEDIDLFRDVPTLTITRRDAQHAPEAVGRGAGPARDLGPGPRDHLSADLRNAKAPAGAGALLVSTASGIRTRVTAVRGRRPSPLDDGGQDASA